MSIANELSCDVASAMFAHKETVTPETDGGGLTEIVLEVHSTLRRLTNEARRRRRTRSPVAATAATTREAAAGSL